MKTLSRLAIAGMAVALTHSAVAADDAETLFGGTFGANVKFATDYVFRGESETNDGQIPAVQGSITWSHPSGFYAGFFGSTNKFASAPDISAVVGPYIGKTGTIGGTDIGYNVMLFDYEYPGANKYNYTELYMYAWKQFGDFNLKFEVTPTLNDWFGVEGWKGINYAVHPKMALPYGVTLDGSYGYQQLDGTGAQGWHHWNLGVSKKFVGLTFDLRYHDTDITSSHKVYGSPAGLKIFDQRVVFAVSKSF